jgi:hypothetical protein
VKRVTRFSIAKESIEDMCRAKRFNPCLEITFRDRAGGHTHKLSAGHSDVLDVYRDGTETYVLSHNEGLGYFGLEVFEGAKITGDMFVESHQVKDILGNENLAPFNIIKRMREYIQ